MDLTPFSRCTALVLALAAGSAHAGGTLADLGLTLDQVRDLNAQLTAPIVAPGIAFGSTTGFGAGWGQLYAGVGGETLPSGSDKPVDGSALFGLGLGDSRRAIALDMSMNVISLQNNFGDSGNWNFKLHRALPGRSSLAVGVEDTGAWGDAQQRGSSTYVAYSKVFDLEPETPKRPLNVAVTLGTGNERFADPDKGGWGAFGAVALAWHRQSTIIADWNGRDLNAAVSLVPMYRVPLIVTLGAINLTERYEKAEFSGGIGYLYQF